MGKSLRRSFLDTVWNVTGQTLNSEKQASDWILKHQQQDNLNQDRGRSSPKRPSASELLTRVTSTGNDRMPPGDHATALSATEVEQLSRWIEQGAKWESHWAFTAPVRVSPPSVQNSNWVQNPIDQFILAKLEQASLSPRPTASPRKLARRLYFDLTGLPPTPQQVFTLPR